MSGGTWTTSSPPVRFGAYFNFLAALQAAVTAGAGGVACVIGTSDWGPISEPVAIFNEGFYDQKFGRAAGTLRDGTLSALDGFDTGGAVSVLAMRIADVSAAVASVSIAAADAAAGVVLSTRYKGVRGNSFTYLIQTNPIDAATKDLIVYESGIELERFERMTNTNTAFAAFITANGQYVTAVIAGAGSRAMANVTATAMTGGASGLAVTGTEFSAAFSVLRETEFNSVVLSDISDLVILKLFTAWVDDELNARGKRCFGFVGGAPTELYAAAKARSSSATPTDVNADSLNIVNVGAVDLRRLSDGVVLSTAQLAARMAGAVAGIGFNRSLTNLRFSGHQVVTPLSDANYVNAITDGVVTFSNDNTQRVVIEMGLTTLTTVSEVTPAVSKKIRNVAVQHFIETTLSRVAKDDYLGTLANTDVGQKDLIASFLQFLKALEQQGALAAGTSEVELDTKYITGGNAIYLRYGIVHVDTVERIFSTVRVR